MLINFFSTLRAAKLPVSVKEYLTLLEAIQAGVIGPSVDDFYYLARTTLVKDEAQFDKFDRAFAAYFKGVELLADFTQDVPLEWLQQDARARTQRRGEGGDREDGLGRADGDAEEALRGAEGAPRRRQQDDRHRRHQPVRRLRLQPAGHPHRPGQGPQQERGQGLGPARLQGLRRHAGARHAQHQGRAAPAAPLRARRLRARTRPRRHDPLHRRQRRHARHQDGARAAQQGEGAAADGRGRHDGRAHPPRRRAVLAPPRPSSSTSSSTTSTTASTTSCGRTTGAASARSSPPGT